MVCAIANWQPILISLTILNKIVQLTDILLIAAVLFTKQAVVQGKLWLPNTAQLPLMATIDGQTILIPQKN